MLPLQLFKPRAGQPVVYDRINVKGVPVSSSRNLAEDLGIETLTGVSSFIINKRNINTSWGVRWNETNFKVIGVMPALNRHKVRLVIQITNEEFATQ